MFYALTNQRTSRVDNQQLTVLWIGTISCIIFWYALSFILKIILSLRLNFIWKLHAHFRLNYTCKENGRYWETLISQKCLDIYKDSAFLLQFSALA